VSSQIQPILASLHTMHTEELLSGSKTGRTVGHIQETFLNLCIYVLSTLYIYYVHGKQWYGAICPMDSHHTIIYKRSAFCRQLNMRACLTNQAERQERDFCPCSPAESRACNLPVLTCTTSSPVTKINDRQYQLRLLQFPTKCNNKTTTSAIQTLYFANFIRSAHVIHVAYRPYIFAQISSVFLKTCSYHTNLYILTSAWVGEGNGQWYGRETQCGWQTKINWTKTAHRTTHCSPNNSAMCQ